MRHALAGKWPRHQSRSARKYIFAAADEPFVATGIGELTVTNTGDKLVSSCFQSQGAVPQVFAQQNVEAGIDHLKVLITDERNSVEAIKYCTDLVDGEPAIVTAYSV
jgi:hypothetical protein